MWTQKSNRKHFIDVVGGKASPVGDFYSSDLIPTGPLHGDDLYLVWEERPGDERRSIFKEGQVERERLPEIVIVNDGHKKDFLSWCATFFPGFRPFTAYVRLLDISTAKRLCARSRSPSLYGLETACAGVIIGESLALSPDWLEPQNLLPVACATTVSYCLARALALGGTEDDVELTTRNWLLARSLTKQSDSSVNINQVKNIWAMIALLRTEESRHRLPLITVGVSPCVMRACIDLIDYGKISEPIWDSLVDGDRMLTNPSNEMEGIREDRVRAFHRVSELLSASRIHDKEALAFLYGYLASLIAPGSMDHFNLLRNQKPERKAALLWYGLCAGLHYRNEVLTAFNVLGRRLVRHLLQRDPICAPPSADLSLDELEVLLSQSAQPYEFRSFSLNVLEIELQPGVSTFMRCFRPDVFGRSDLPSESLGRGIDEVSVKELTVLLDRANEICRRLSIETGKRRTQYDPRWHETKRKKPTRDNRTEPYQTTLD